MKEVEEDESGYFLSGRLIALFLEDKALKDLQWPKIADAFSVSREHFEIVRGALSVFKKGETHGS